MAAACPRPRALCTACRSPRQGPPMLLWTLPARARVGSSYRSHPRVSRSRLRARLQRAQLCRACAQRRRLRAPRVDLMSVGGQDGAATLIGRANLLAGSAPHVGTCAAPVEARERAVAHDWGRHFLFWSLVRCVCTRSIAYCAVRRVRAFVFHLRTKYANVRRQCGGSKAQV